MSSRNIFPHSDGARRVHISSFVLLAGFFHIRNSYGRLHDYVVGLPFSSVAIYKKKGKRSILEKQTTSKLDESHSIDSS